MKNSTTVFYHSADLDGLFCREIARNFLQPDTTFIGWNFGDPHPAIPDGQIYVMDLPVDRLFGMEFGLHPTIEPLAVALPLSQIIWIDHHASSIESHPKNIPGYRIDGVAACRLAWQWFLKEQRDAMGMIWLLPDLRQYKEREVTEPLAIRLAGEYDIFDKHWKKEDPRVDLFQHAMRSRVIDDAVWRDLLHEHDPVMAETLLADAELLQFARDQEYAQVIKEQGFDVSFEGVLFLACCSHECDIRSQLFKEGIKGHHEALLGFTFTGKDWRVSLYHIEGREDVDILSISKARGGGGHKGANGFHAEHLPFLP